MYELLLSATVKKEKMFFKYKYYQSLLIILIMPLATAAEPEIQELEEITVTAPAGQDDAEWVKPVAVLSDEALRTKVAHSIGETLKNELGITSQSFGPAVGTPVIRGQSGARVKVLNSGMSNGDISQLSPDHASSSEPFMAERIEVLRGPATLLYGSGAIGGVVNVLDNRIPTAQIKQPVSGAFEQRYDTAVAETSTALKAEGGKDQMAYHLDGLFRDRNNMAIGGQAIDVSAAESLDPTLKVIQNTQGSVPNTNAQTMNGSAGLSWVADPGFAGVAINQLHNNYGIAPDGSGGANTRIDIQQSKYDFKSVVKQPFSLVDVLKSRFAYTDYNHVELDGGVPGTAFTNKTFEGRLELNQKPWGDLNGTMGLQGSTSNFTAMDFQGNQTIVPNSLINSYSVFGFQSLQKDVLTYQVSARVEANTIDPQAGSNYISPNGLPINSSYQYLPVSASASALWDIDAHDSLSLALTRSQRAPQVQELLSHGFHDATRSFELGDPNLHMETSYNLDLAYKFKSDWVRIELNLFNTWANSYIYQRRTGQFVKQDAITGMADVCPANIACTAVVQSQQADALFRGYENKWVFPVMENNLGILDLTLFSDYTRGTFLNGGDVPRMPPLRFGFQWDYLYKEWSANVRFTRAEAQQNPGLNDTTTAGYYLLSLGSQYEIKDFHGSKIMLFTKANNLLNENIRNSVSYLRNFAPEPGRGVEVGFRVSY